LTEYEQSYDLTWGKADNITKYKGFHYSDKFYQYTELRIQALEACDKKIEDRTELDTTDSDYDKLEGLRM
jgi:hypothetical protein